MGYYLVGITQLMIRAFKIKIKNPHLVFKVSKFAILDTRNSI